MTLRAKLHQCIVPLSFKASRSAVQESRGVRGKLVRGKVPERRKVERREGTKMEKGEKRTSSQNAEETGIGSVCKEGDDDKKRERKRKRGFKTFISSLLANSLGRIRGLANKWAVFFICLYCP